MADEKKRLRAEKRSGRLGRGALFEGLEQATKVYGQWTRMAGTVFQKTRLVQEVEHFHEINYGLSVDLKDHLNYFKVRRNDLIPSIILVCENVSENQLENQNVRVIKTFHNSYRRHNKLY